MYMIEGFSPSAHMTAGGYGFNVLLRKDIVLALFNKDYKEGERISNIAESHIDILFGENQLLRPHYHFMERKNGKISWLLQYCTVPGNACDLGIAFADLNDTRLIDEVEYVIYSSHNVDGVKQAYALLSIWLTWFNTIKSAIRDDIKLQRHDLKEK